MSVFLLCLSVFLSLTLSVCSCFHALSPHSLTFYFILNERSRGSDIWSRGSVWTRWEVEGNFCERRRSVRDWRWQFLSRIHSERLFDLIPHPRDVSSFHSLFIFQTDHTNFGGKSCRMKRRETNLLGTCIDSSFSSTVKMVFPCLECLEGVLVLSFSCSEYIVLPQGFSITGVPLISFSTFAFNQESRQKVHVLSETRVRKLISRTKSHDKHHLPTAM